MKRWLFYVGACVICSACSQSEPNGPVQSTPVPVAPVIRPTKAEWQTAFSGTFTKTAVNVSESGMQQFAACFAPVCKDLLALARYDPFKGVTYFYGFFTGPYITLNSGIGLYIAAADCLRPNLVLRTNYVANSWLFLRNLGMLADGKLVYSGAIEHGDVARDIYGSQVEEVHIRVLQPDEIAQIRSVLSATDLKVRITGDKGYVTVKPKHVAEFVKEANKLVQIFDRIEQAVAEKIPPSCV